MHACMQYKNHQLSSCSVYVRSHENIHCVCFQTGGINDGVGIATWGTRLPRSSTVRAAPNCMAVEKPMASTRKVQSRETQPTAMVGPLQTARCKIICCMDSLPDLIMF